MESFFHLFWFESWLFGTYLIKLASGEYTTRRRSHLTHFSGCRLMREDSGAVIASASFVSAPHAGVEVGCGEDATLVCGAGVPHEKDQIENPGQPIT